VTTPGNGTPFDFTDYVRARDALVRALRGPRSYALLIGGSGMGKTRLAAEIGAALDRRTHHFVYVAAARASVVGIVRLCARELCLRTRRSHLERLVAVTETIAAQSTHWVLWLDDADQIAASTLAALRTVVEAVPAATPLLSVVLGGSSVLASRLDEPGLFALKRRIALRCTLAGLRRDELAAFLTHGFGARLAERVPSSVHDELFERTGAAPALVERIVRHALEHQPQGLLDEDHLRAILDTAGL
jgi:type II secretory pathway predicted ATPase ExeA